MKKLLLSITAMGLASAALAQEETACGPSLEVHSFLANKYGEEPVFRGLDEGGALVEIWAGETSWSFLLTRPGQDGPVSCLLDDGEVWEGPKPNL